MGFTTKETLIGIMIIMIFILFFTIPMLDHLITPGNLILVFIIVLIVGGGAFVLNNNNVDKDNSKFSEKSELVLDGQTQNVSKTSNKKSVDGKQVSFKEKIITTTVTDESRGESNE